MTTTRKTRSFRHADLPEEAAPATEPPRAESFWRRLFGGKAVSKERLARPAAVAGRASSTPPKARTDRPRAGGSAPLLTSLPEDLRPRNPKSFLAKKFNSQVVKAALLDAIGAAMDRPPPGLDPLDAKFWVEGLAFKGTLVEQLDCPALKPEEHLRAIGWMAKVEKLNPLKATYREDLFALRYQLGKLDQKDPPLPEAVGQGGVALRRLFGVVRSKLEGLGNLSDEQSATAQRELAAYERLIEAIEKAPVAALAKRDLLLLANVFRRIDPYRIELTARHAQFEDNVVALLGEMDAIYASAEG